MSSTLRAASALVLAVLIAGCGGGAHRGPAPTDAAGADETVVAEALSKLP